MLYIRKLIAMQLPRSENHYTEHEKEINCKFRSRKSRTLDPGADLDDSHCFIQVDELQNTIEEEHANFVRKEDRN
ncbi:hypothetical protein ACJIZ3_017469 [Penstemon smallii]|uniref:Uncharacterized protein n=1 Tax=Penstemon smallii TaxID=265156 RepID=A0ABD3SWX1_9LAMI